MNHQEHWGKIAKTLWASLYNPVVEFSRQHSPQKSQKSKEHKTGQRLCGFCTFVIFVVKLLLAGKRGAWRLE
jgi:hypothetical protein